LGDTALHFALNIFGADTNRNQIAGLLLDYGADPFAEAGYLKDTPIGLAITRADGWLVPRMLGQDTRHPLGKKALKQTGKPRRPPATGWLAGQGAALLAAAAQRGELEAVQALLQAGVPAQTNAPEGYSILQVFARAAVAAGGDDNLASNRWGQIRDRLIKKGADYDVFSATILGDLPQVQHLLAADASLTQARDRDGQTPLHWAVLNHQPAILDFWLHAGAAPAATNLAGQTPLHLAAAKGLAEPVRQLLAAGAPTGLRDTNGWTPLEAAIHAQQSETIRLLLADNPLAPYPERAIAKTIHQAAGEGDLAALAALAATTTNLEARNELGLTPLQLAVQSGHLAAAALLVDQGADVNVRDPDGNTLLTHILLGNRSYFIIDRPPLRWFDRLSSAPHKAAFIKYLTVGENQQGPNPLLQAASFLLACGLDARATNQAGQSPFSWCPGTKTCAGFTSLMTIGPNCCNCSARAESISTRLTPTVTRRCIWPVRKPLPNGRRV
jgi:ankyrin repeat protein